jgi:hypothetical protein
VASLYIPFFGVHVSGITVVPWCTAGTAPNPVIESLVVHGYVFPYYDTLTAYIGDAGDYALMGGVIIGTNDSTRAACEGLPTGGGITELERNQIFYNPTLWARLQKAGAGEKK